QPKAEVEAREQALAAREKELGLLQRRLAAVAKEQRDVGDVDRIRAEMRALDDDLSRREKAGAERRDRGEAQEERMEKLELEVKDRTAKLQKLEDELRVREARREAELEIHEDKLAARLAQVEEREARLAQREADLAGYVERVQQQISAA